MTEIAVNLPLNIGDTEPLTLVLFDGEDSVGSESLTEVPGTLGRFIAEFEGLESDIAYRAVVLRNDVPIYDDWLTGLEVGSPKWIAKEGTQNEILDKVSEVKYGPGTGMFRIVLTIRKADLTPIPDCEVMLTASPTSPSIGIVAGGRTLFDGTITFDLDEGVYYIWRQKTGISFTNPKVLTVSPDGSYVVS